MNRRQRQEFYDDIDMSISNLHKEDLKKLEYARNLTEDLLSFFDTEGSTQIQLGPLERKTFEYFIFIILSEYYSKDWKPEEYSSEARRIFIQ